MIDKNFRESALEEYGSSCEICGHRTSLEVHHIDYQEHQAVETILRHFLKEGNEIEFKRIMKEAIAMGYDEFDKKTKQLSKNDSTLNTAVLCGNCHGLIHTMDVGKKLLRAIAPRTENV